jgi:hypothetical protein
MAGGHKVYGVFVSPGTGYRDDATTGVATGSQPQGAYMVASGTHVNSGCCFDYGNAETNNRDNQRKKSLSSGSGKFSAVVAAGVLTWGSCYACPGGPRLPRAGGCRDLTEGMAKVRAGMMGVLRRGSGRPSPGSSRST